MSKSICKPDFLYFFLNLSLTRIASSTMPSNQGFVFVLILTCFTGDILSITYMNLVKKSEYALFTPSEVE